MTDFKNIHISSNCFDNFSFSCIPSHYGHCQGDCDSCKLGQIFYRSKIERCKCGRQLDKYYTYIINKLIENKLLVSTYEKICCSCRKMDEIDKIEII